MTVEGNVLHIDVDLSESSQSLDVGFDESAQYLDIELMGGGSGRFPYYKGEYEIEPRKSEQTLSVEDKSMKDDVIIRPIFYAETINQGGGYTAVIGAE